MVSTRETDELTTVSGPDRPAVGPGCASATACANTGAAPKGMRTAIATSAEHLSIRKLGKRILA
jgi:hypothetical protein